MKAGANLLIIPLIYLSCMNLQAHPRSLAPPDATAPQNSQDNGAPQRSAPGEGRGIPLFGKMTAIHDQSIEIARPNGEAVTVKINDETQFRRERQAAKLSDFKVGDFVVVRGQENPDHTWTAQMIGSGPMMNGPGVGPGGGIVGGFQGGELGKDFIFGEVKSVDAPKLTIQRPDNVTQTIELNENVSLRRGRESITMADIQNGDHVVIRGAMKDDVFVPRSVVVIGPDQWKRMHEMGITPGSAPNQPKDATKPEKP
jgi:preprotein translocase subunit YajC